MMLNSDDESVHQSILAFGWDEWRSKHQMGSQHYCAFMKRLNPYAKAYFGMYERYLLAERLLKEAQQEREHYKLRYLDIASSARDTMKSFAASGVHLSGVTSR